MKTLLISPPYPLFGGETKFASPPLGLAYIAAVLEEAGQEVDVLDCVVADYDNEYVNDHGLLIYGLEPDTILERNAAYKPDIIGISCLFSTVDLTVNDLADRIKEQHPSITIVLGGTHATVMAEDLVRRDSIDFVVKGEGEQAFLELVELYSAVTN
jgi:anaerobic magnesium-protoporphyrin IX monomethyl ester cyclase